MSKSSDSDVLAHLVKVFEDRMSSKAKDVLWDAIICVPSLDARAARQRSTVATRPAHNRLVAAAMTNHVMEAYKAEQIDAKDLEQIIARIAASMGIIVAEDVDASSGYAKLSKSQLHSFLGIMQDAAKTQRIEGWVKAGVMAVGGIIALHGLAVLNIGHVVLGAGIAASGTQVKHWREHKERVVKAFPRIKNKGAQDALAEFAASTPEQGGPSQLLQATNME